MDRGSAEDALFDFQHVGVRLCGDEQPLACGDAKSPGSGECMESRGGGGALVPFIPEAEREWRTRASE